MTEEKNDKHMNRRDYLKSAATTGTIAVSALSGCLGRGIFGGSDAEELRSAVNETETNLKNELPWNDYELDFDVEDLDLDLESLGATGVENAKEYAANIDIALQDDSDDLDGWMAAQERQEEFFRLYAPPTYDMLLESYDNLSEFTVPNQPSHRNQITEYSLHIDASECSYIEDNIAAPRVDDITSSPDAYLSYLNGGQGVEINIESAFLGIEYLC